MAWIRVATRMRHNKIYIYNIHLYRAFGANLNYIQMKLCIFMSDVLFYIYNSTAKDEQGHSVIRVLQLNNDNIHAFRKR